ncbi:phospho-sugar mutase [Nocardioides sp. WL0053]|uniref:Phospho-sugar mutase n=1 Tax=Nocardioides jiangsuensis TaxID=2866161 RepID=A0ABS7RMW5_9ACTN|nr:phospho-sugar mutase [Nocardioides jiangsuensis]MBY9076399.1 phospho-sugar mutase [Nocardioides jiangsuensis]
MTASTDSTDLLDRARAWAAEDPDPRTRAELEALLAQVEAESPGGAAAADLADRFAGRLEFGTAGLRGALGAGPNRMNRAVVVRAAAGLASYLKQQGAGPDDSVVIGYDARHDSDVFAHDTAAVMVGAGLRAQVLPRPLPTPVLAYAIRELGCVAGVMVTASHNPPQDNGYKVYLGDGSQIVPPADAGISREIDAVGALDSVPRGEGWERLGDDVVDSYKAKVAALVDAGTPRDLVSVYTPLHGVGGETVAEVLERAGFPAPHVAVAQAEPDPEFPTVAFPNPEEPGAMDLAMALAEEVGADLVLANDPDADRCAAAVPGPHGWRMLRGDEVGALLADAALRRGVQGVYATTIVSSSLLGTMAAAHGQEYRETLTGFKWLGRVDGLAFAYEEALGYCAAPELVRDKDGVSALLRLAELAATLKAEGRTLDDRLDDIARTYGLHATDQLSVRVTDLAQIDAAMSRLRAAPPVSLGGLAVERVDDLAEGSADLLPTEGLRYTLAEGARVVVRPSGTEPKLKCYLEVVVPVEEGEPGGVDAARIAAAGRLDAIRTDLAAAAGL